MTLEAIQELVLTLKGLGVTKYKDQHVELEINLAPPKGASHSGLGQSAGGQVEDPAYSSPQETYAPHREVTTRLNPLYFDPALGLEIKHRE